MHVTNNVFTWKLCLISCLREFFGSGQFSVFYEYALLWPDVANFALYCVVFPDMIWVYIQSEHEAVTIRYLVAIFYRCRVRRMRSLVVGIPVLELQRWRGWGRTTFFPPWQVDIRIESWKEQGTRKISMIVEYTKVQNKARNVGFNICQKSI